MSTLKTKQRKQKTTVIICLVLSVLLLAGTLYVVIDHAVHANDLYKQFSDESFAKTISTALGYDSPRELKQEDLDKVEVLVYSWAVGNDSNNGYASYYYPTITLGYKTLADQIINGEEINDDTAVAAPYLPSDFSDITRFKNLRVLRMFDISEVSSMQQSCQYTQLYSQMVSGVTPVSFGSIINSCNLDKIKSLEQFKGLDALEHISLEYTGITTLDGINNFPKLTKIDIGNTKIEDISKVAEFPALESLVLASLGDRSNVAEDEDETSEDETSEDEKSEDAEKELYGLKDISALAGLTKLKYLNFSDNAVTDISALKDLSALEDLVMNSNGVESIDAIAKATELKNLYVADNKLADISALKNCTKLEVFSAADNKIKDISALGKCVALTDIYVSSNEVGNIGDLSKLENLAVFSAAENAITDISSLGKCSKLTTLTVNDNLISVVGDFSACDELTTFQAYNNKFEKVELKGLAKLATVNVYNDKGSEYKTLKELVLDELPVLARIDAHGQDLAAVPDLSGITELTTVDFSDNSISDMSALNGLEKLATVNLSGNHIKELSGLKDLKALSSLDLSKNAISSIAYFEEVFNEDSELTITLTGNFVTSDTDAMKAFQEKYTDITLVYASAAPADGTDESAEPSEDASAAESSQETEESSQETEE